MKWNEKALLNKIHKWIYRESERIWKSSWKKFWKFQVNTTNFGGVFVVKYIFIYASNFGFMKFYWGQLKLVSIFFVFGIKTKLLKIIKNAFCFTKDAFNICTSLFPAFFFLDYCWFCRSWLMINTKVYGINMSLN